MYLAAAVVVAAAVVAATVVAYQAVVATATEQDEQDDDPAAVTTEEAIVTHKEYLQGFFRAAEPFIPWYSAEQKMCGREKAAFLRLKEASFVNEKIRKNIFC